MTKMNLTAEQIFKKGEKLGLEQWKLDHIEGELETKMCKECAHLFDPADFEYASDGIEDMMFCSKCGGELEENTNLDQFDCAICGEELREEGEGYITDDEKQAVCYDCYDHIPEELPSKEVQKPKEMKTEEKQTTEHKPVRMITSNELAGKTIIRSYQADWNGTHVVITQDGCICATYSQYDSRSGQRTHSHILDVEDFYRLCQ